MTLPKVKKKKVINSKLLIKLAKKVRESLEEEESYLLEKKLKNGDTLSSRTNSFS